MSGTAEIRRRAARHPRFAVLRGRRELRQTIDQSAFPIHAVDETRDHDGASDSGGLRWLPPGNELDDILVPIEPGRR
jgi:hypothetical protein